MCKKKEKRKKTVRFKGQKWPKNRASWEVYWKNNQFETGLLRGRVDNI
jgi:hypothetical protein